jgi:hypothetical protein
VKRVDDPLYSVARGALVAARSDEEEQTEQAAEPAAED